VQDGRHESGKAAVQVVAAQPEDALGALDAFADDPGLAQDALVVGERRLADREARRVVQLGAGRVADGRQRPDRARTRTTRRPSFHSRGRSPGRPCGRRYGSGAGAARCGSHVNDIAHRPDRPTAAQISEGLFALARRARERGLRPVLGTTTPFMAGTFESFRGDDNEDLRRFRRARRRRRGRAPAAR
jgi:hypothetical protein